MAFKMKGSPVIQGTAKHSALKITHIISNKKQEYKEDLLICLETHLIYLDGKEIE